MSTSTLANTAQVLLDSMTPKFAVSYLRVSTRGQAERGGGHDEGFSIPAQREANKKKAMSMGAIVGKEFVDRGASAKSADRPQLQAMLEYVKENADRVDYVIVHKVDRLARNRDDDSDIMRVLRECGVQLVSASESIDNTPSGMLLHGIMSSIAEFYSQNLAAEVKKGMGEKVKSGGTVGRAPLGYTNVRRVDEKGREDRTVEIDPERAPLVQLAFEEYATGKWSIVGLSEHLAALGLSTRSTPKIPSKPISRSATEKMLKNPYYAGVIRYSINKILRDSGFQGFSIRAKVGVENVYEVIREDGSVAENLSEGERNFIAFLYFYHQVRGSMSSEELKEKIVVIDDPVSSMDSTALFLVSAIVREMINVCRNNTEYLNPKVPGDYIKQLFVLTHNVYFHREVTYQQVSYYNCTSFYMIRKNDNISTIKLCKRQSKEIPTEDENYNPVQNSYAALWDELRDIQSTIPALNVMRRILEYYFLQLCGYEGSDLREIVLDEHRSKFIKQAEGEKPDMTDYQLASSLLAYINNPNGISDGLNYVEDCEDVEAYKRVFKMIFDALDQSQHYKMMTGKQLKS